MINQKDFASARRFIGDRYRQHNPLVGDGPEGLGRFIAGLQTDYPEARSEVVRVVAEGDLVVLHVRSTRTPADERAIVEIFRLLPDGRIDEHWDVIQPARTLRRIPTACSEGGARSGQEVGLSQGLMMRRGWCQVHFCCVVGLFSRAVS